MTESSLTIQTGSSEELGILVGLLLTDGWVSKKQIGLSNKSKEMHRIFKEKVSLLFGIQNFREGKSGFDVNQTELNSTLIVKKLEEICKLENFRRKPFLNGIFPELKLPDFIKELNHQEKCKVLQVMFSADGSISLSVRWHKGNKNWEIRRRIELACKHPTLRKDFMQLLESLGFHPVNSGNENITLERKEDILKFAKDVRFIDGVKIRIDSENWCGIEKNKVLDAAVKTFEFNNHFLKKFKTREEIIRFLKSLL